MWSNDAMRRFRTATIAITIGAALTLLASVTAHAAPPHPTATGPTMPAAFDLTRYQPADPLAFRSIAYADNGRSYFATPRWTCQVGPSYRYVGCQGRPATAPPGTIGVTIAGDQQGPWWVGTGSFYTPSYRFGAPSGFRAPMLGVGKRVTMFGVTCTVPAADTVACRTGDRALILTPAWHKFFFPTWDSRKPGVSAVAHSNNPAPQQLPPQLRYWNQLPAQPAAPR